jgi:NAD(P)H-dependent FMN reductase
MTHGTILTLVGSLRSGSINRQLAEAAAAQAPAGVRIQPFSDLADVPFYNEDLDEPRRRPAAADSLRHAVAQAEAVLLVSPEYNGAMPAVLKNAVDWLSRPYGNSALSGKPAAVIGAAFGKFGGAWAHDEARRSLEIAGAHVLQELTLSVGGSNTRFADRHPEADPEVMEQVRTVLASLAAASERTSV